MNITKKAPWNGRNSYVSILQLSRSFSFRFWLRIGMEFCWFQRSIYAIEDNKMLLLCRHEQLSWTNYRKKNKGKFCGQSWLKKLRLIATTGTVTTYCFRENYYVNLWLFMISLQIPIEFNRTIRCNDGFNYFNRITFSNTAARIWKTWSDWRTKEQNGQTNSTVYCTAGQKKKQRGTQLDNNSYKRQRRTHAHGCVHCTQTHTDRERQSTLVVVCIVVT